MKLRLTTYRGYANEQEIVVYGHLLKKNTSDNADLNGKRFEHAYAVLRMFTVETVANVTITLKFGELKATTKTLKDGYFHFALPHTEALESGWHTYEVSALVNDAKIEQKGELVKPYPGEYGLISDIDDTFLVSYSDSFFKKIYVLLTRNVRKRKIFDGVVEHYRLLSQAGRKNPDESNAFFYVSSSEWNLYSFIERFAQLHHFPKAVLKLKKIKSGLGDFLFTGGGSHDHKFHKIKHLLEFYPDLKFILLGDDSQKDPFIYERIVKLFPVGVKAIYIRCTGKDFKTNVTSVLENIQAMAVETCYFKDSASAIQHSKDIGLVT